MIFKVAHAGIIPYLGGYTCLILLKNKFLHNLYCFKENNLLYCFQQASLAQLAFSVAIICNDTEDEDQDEMIAARKLLEYIEAVLV
jgi:hypothetical protein